MPVEDLQPALLAGLDLNPALQAANFLLHTKQKHVVNMLVPPTAANNLNVILHFVEQCVVLDIDDLINSLCVVGDMLDDFINSVGVRAVMAVWRLLLMVCPQRTKRLVGSMWMR